jgi:purine-binding chemotaxis protein CheW
MVDIVGARLLVFRVGAVQCAVEASEVREIIAVEPPTRIPGAPPAVLGVMNIRGRIVTLVDVCQRLTLPSRDAAGSLVLLDVGSRTVGLMVDEVLDLISVPEAALAEREELPGVGAEYVRAVGRHGDHTFALLDTDALVSPILPS